MTHHAVTRLRPRTYTDTAALNDIHTILTSALSPDSMLAEVAAVLVMADRPHVVPLRDIEVDQTETEVGRPLVCVQSEDITVRVRQEEAGPGLLVQIHGQTLDAVGELTVQVDTEVLFCAGRVLCDCPA
jgi:hypothetical protein